MLCLKSHISLEVKTRIFMSLISQSEATSIYYLTLFSLSSQKMGGYNILKRAITNMYLKYTICHLCVLYMYYLIHLTVDVLGIITFFLGRWGNLGMGGKVIFSRLHVCMTQSWDSNTYFEVSSYTLNHYTGAYRFIEFTAESIYGDVKIKTCHSPKFWL